MKVLTRLQQKITQIRGLKAVSKREEREGPEAREECVGFAEEAVPNKERYGQVFHQISPWVSQFEWDWS